MTSLLPQSVVDRYPTYEHEGIAMVCADCLEVLPMLEAGSVDAVITDPPYGIGESSAKNATRSKVVSVKNYGENFWDKKRVDYDVFAEIFRLSNEQVIFGGNYYSDYLPPSSSWIVWDKLNTGDFADCELIWTSHKRAVRKFTYKWNGMFKQYPEERYHLTQKPIRLMTWIVNNYTAENQSILDPFAGSGTTLVACIQTGRRGIGIEIDRGYRSGWIFDDCVNKDDMNTYAQCDYCGCNYKIRTDGRFPKHTRKIFSHWGPRRETCPGSGVKYSPQAQKHVTT